MRSSLVVTFFFCCLATPQLVSSQESQLNKSTADCPAYPSQITFNVSQEFLDLAIHAANFSILSLNSTILKDTLKPDYERFDSWRDVTRSDESLVAKHQGTCFVAFSPLAGVGNLQNLHPIPRRVGINECYVRRAWWDSYQPLFRDSFNDALQACLQSCLEDPVVSGFCPLVLTGWSHGGGVAVAASLDLASYNPTVITFGAPRALLNVRNEDCQMDFSRHYRFINMNHDDYDRIPFYVDFFKEKHYGWPLFIEWEGPAFPILTTGLNDNTKRTSLRYWWQNPFHNTPFDRSTHHYHSIYNTLDRFLELKQQKCFPIPVSQWPTGHFCFYDDECLSQACVNNNCG